MTAPEYDWSCLNCRHKNIAKQEACASCGLPARFTVRQLAALQPDPKPEELAYERKPFFDILTFIPEVPIALICLVCTPGWVIQSLLDGRWFAALGLTIAAAGVLVALWFAIVRKEKWLGYGAILLYILCVLLING